MTSSSDPGMPPVATPARADAGKAAGTGCVRPFHPVARTICLIALLSGAVICAGSTSGCGTRSRAVRVNVTDHEGQPVPDAVILVESGSVRRDPIRVEFHTRLDGSVVVDSIARAPVRLLVTKTAYHHREVTVPSHHDADKRPVLVELSPTEASRADTVRSDGHRPVVY